MRSTAGFTLIELMMVLVIISVMTLLTLPSMRDTLAETRLYASTRSVVETLTFARMQAIMRNQAHEVRFTLNPSGAGGKVEVYRHMTNRCTNVLPGVIMAADIKSEVGLTNVLNEQQVDVGIAAICFKPNGKASDVATGNPLTGELLLELQRFEAPDGASAVIGWPLYVRLSNMGIAVLVKTLPAIPPGGAA